MPHIVHYTELLSGEGMTEAKSVQCYDKASNCAEVLGLKGACHRHGKDCKKVRASFIYIFFCDTMFRVVDFALAIPHMKATLIAMTQHQVDVMRWQKILVIEIRRSAKR